LPFWEQSVPVIQHTQCLLAQSAAALCHAARLALSLATLAFVSGCSGAQATTEGGQTGGEEPPGTACKDSSATEMSLDRSVASAAGFSANQLLGALAATPVVPFTFASGAQTRLTVSVDYSGPTEYGSSCRELTVGTQLKFVTADQVFDERLAAPLVAARVDAASIELNQIPSSSLHGSLDGTELGSYDTATLDFVVDFSAQTAHGEVLGHGFESGKLSKTFVIATF
jgi:hypothetical protein